MQTALKVHGVSGLPRLALKTVPPVAVYVYVM